MALASHIAVLSMHGLIYAMGLLDPGTLGGCESSRRHQMLSEGTVLHQEHLNKGKGIRLLLSGPAGGGVLSLGQVGRVV